MWPFPVLPMAGKYPWHLMGSRGRRRRREVQEPKQFHGNTDGCLLWQNASSITLWRNSLKPLASTRVRLLQTHGAAPLPTPDMCLISSFSVLLTHHANCCQRTPDIHPEVWQLSPSASLSCTRGLGLCCSVHLQCLHTLFLCQGHSWSSTDTSGTCCLS